MILILPCCPPFAAPAPHWELVGAELEGPERMGLPSVSGTTDGGGYWALNLAEMLGRNAADHRAREAFALLARGGRVVDIPYVRRDMLGAVVPTPFSDGATFSDGSAYAGGTVEAVLYEACGLRDDEIVVEMSVAPRFGDAFSVFRGFDRGSEMHKIATVEDLGSDRYRLQVGPFMRQSWDAGTELNFNRPRCAMVIPRTRSLWAPIPTGSNFATASLVAVEAV